MKGIEIGICPFLSHCTVMLLLRLFEPIGAIRLEKRFHQHHQQPLQGMTNRKQHNSSYREGIMVKMVELRKIVGSLS
jgi:hypothetical protein